MQRVRSTSVVKLGIMLAIFFTLVIGFYVWVNITWRDTTTWDKGVVAQLERFLEYENLDLTVDAVASDLNLHYYDKKYVFRYASLVGIERKGDKVKYIFSLAPYSYLTKIAHNKKEYIDVSRKEGLLFELVIPVKIKPKNFLGRRIFSTATYTSEPEELLLRRKPVPVSVSFVLRQYDMPAKPAGLLDKIEHWSYVIRGEKEPINVEVVKWELGKLETAKEYVTGLSAKEVEDKLARWSRDVWQYYKNLCLKEAIDNWNSVEENGKVLLKSIYKNCSAMYNSCTLRDCNQVAREMDPSIIFTYLLYLAYHYDLDAYKKLKYTYKTYFKNQKASELCGDAEYGWCSYWPAVFSAYPVRKEKELLDFYFSEVGYRHAFSRAINQKGVDKSMYSLAHWYSLPFQNYGKAEYTILTNKAGCSATDKIYKGLTNRKIITEIDRLLSTRGICQGKREDTLETSLLAWPVNKKLALLYIYTSYKLSPYKDIRLFRPRALDKTDLYNMISYNQKDNILTLLLAYELAVANK